MKNRFSMRKRGGIGLVSTPKLCRTVQQGQCTGSFFVLLRFKLFFWSEFFGLMRQIRCFLGSRRLTICEKNLQILRDEVKYNFWTKLRKTEFFKKYPIFIKNSQKAHIWAILAVFGENREFFNFFSSNIMVLDFISQDL